MPEITGYKPGQFCWTELATSDQNAAKDFYKNLFGWEVEDAPMDEGSVYSMMHIGGKYTSGMYAMQKDMRDQGIPPHWMTYVAVSSAEEAATKARELGGTVVMESFDVMDAGRMSVIRDPGGAVLSLWEPIKHHGAGLFNEIGAMCWTELQAHDLDVSKAFYTGLFGWVAKESPEYTEFLLDGISHAGMMKIAPEWGSVPPNWAVYFRVESCDATVEKATALGAKVFVPPMDIPNVGRFSVLQDPQGAVFSVITLSMPE